VSPLVELALLFTRLGVTAFGGPAAHIAMMQHEVVERRRWLTSEEFLDLLGATNFIPGPNSTELAIHIGHRRAGWKGLLVAGTCFILPAALATLAFAWTYDRVNHLSQAAAVLYGIKPFVLAVVLQAVWALGRTAVKNRGLAALGMTAVVAQLVGVNELLVLFGAGALYVALDSLRSSRQKPPSASLLFGALPVVSGAATPSISSGGILFVFFKIGSVLLAFLRSELVEQRHWLTEAQLLDAVAVGQITPGPVFSTATFVGYLLHGVSGAVAATVGIFLPAFFFVAVSAPFLSRLRQSPGAGRFLDGVNVASLALMAPVLLDLGRAAVVDAWTLGFALAGGVLLLRYRVNAAWLVVASGLLGVLVR
jgi:chromate transporter